MCFLTIDSVAEGVGRSQIIPVVAAVAAAGWRVQLVSMEKEDGRGPMTSELVSAAGVEHIALPFGARGKLGGATRVLRLAGRIQRSDIYHCRSDIPFLAAELRRKSPTVWDSRSFWSEQRAAGDRLSRASPIFWALDRVEGVACHHADGVITLTKAAAGQLLAKWGRLPEHQRVIPTLTNLNHFPLADMPPANPVVACLSGTFGPNYDLTIAWDFLRAFGECVGAKEDLNVIWTSTADVHPGSLDFPMPVTHTVTDYGDLPQVIAGSHFGLVPIRFGTGRSMAAMSPTKVGEFLATGRPVVITSGVGDLNEILTSFRAGVLLGGTDERSLVYAAEQLGELIRDPETPRRCREAARRHFDLEWGTRQLIGLYDEILNGQPRKH